MAEDDLDEVFDLLCLGVLEVKLKCNGFAEIVWRNPVETAFGDFVVAVFAAVFEQEFVEIELDFVLEGRIVGSPFVVRFAGLEIGHGDGFGFVVDFDAVDFAGKWDVADHDVFGKEATFGFGVRVANLVAALGEELLELAITAKMELLFSLLTASMIS